MEPIATGVGDTLEGAQEAPSIAAEDSPVRYDLARTLEELAEFDRWAEPLQKNLARVLVLNLSTLLSTDRVALHPWDRSTPMDYQAIVGVGRFEAGTAGATSLLAPWSIVDGADRKILRVRKSSFSEPIADGGYEATVASMSRAVAALSREIAVAIRDLMAN